MHVDKFRDAADAEGQDILLVTRRKRGGGTHSHTSSSMHIHSDSRELCLATSAAEMVRAPLRRSTTGSRPGASSRTGDRE